MLNLISILIGLVALVPALVAFLPLFGWLYWFILPIAVVGLGIGVLSRGRAGRNLNLVVLLVGLARLAIGHGIF
jgi:choline-glycine betaine transporter